MHDAGRSEETPSLKKKQWRSYSSAVFVDGVRSRAVIEDTFANDGSTLTSQLTHRLLDGEVLPDKTSVWKRK